jgi:hypothetical protein
MTIQEVAGIIETGEDMDAEDLDLAFRVGGGVI